MIQPVNESDLALLEYARRRRWWRKFGLLWAFILYMLVYAILRFSGVYYAFYNQASWEISGGTGIVAVDAAFLPLSLAEDAVLNQVPLLPEPTGG